MRSSFVNAPRLVKYPEVSPHPLERDTEWVACETDRNPPLERWGLFRSGQFVHHRAVDTSLWENRCHVLEILDTVTQVFELADRLAKQYLSSPTTAITLDLLDVAGLGLMWPT